MKVLLILNFLLFSFIFSSVSFADADQNGLFFLGGTPKDDFNSVDATVLYSLDSERAILSRLRAINSLSQGTEFIRPYHDEGIVVIGSYIEPGYFQIDIVSMSQPEAERSIEVKACSTCNLLGSYLTEDNSSLKYLFNFGMMSKGELLYSLKSSDLMSGNESNADWADFSGVMSFGSSGGNVAGGDELKSVFSDSRNAVYRFDKKVSLNWKLPADLELQSGESIIQAVNSKRYRVITTNRSYVLNEPVHRTIYRVFDKEKKLWSSYELDGDYLRVRVLDGWLVSEKSFYGFNRTDELKAYRNKVAESLIDRKVIFERKGNYLERLAHLNIDQPGVLMLKSLRSDQYYEIKANNPDSEILLIDGNQVIYRDADEIRTAYIKNGQIEKGTLIARGEHVMSIHWAFKKQ